MLSNTRTNTSPTRPSPIPSTSRKHAYGSSPTTLEPRSKRVKQSMKDQRRDLTQSIISNLPRDELEKLLLDAALEDEGTMQEVIKANSMKRGPVTSQDQQCVGPGMLNLEIGVELERHVADGSEARFKEILDLEEEGKFRESMDAIRGMEEDRPLQFHHVTQRQFEVRKAKIMGKLKPFSDQETPL